MLVPKGVKVAVGVLVALGVLAFAGVYAYVTSGGMVARQKPSQAETTIARWMVRVSVPDSAKMAKNPLQVDANSLDTSAGRDLYKQKCETCHAYDGSGKTDAGSGLYPPPLDLRSAEIRNATDGELFYFIRNGIRNTAMPGWQMPDQDTWRLVVFIRDLPKVASLVAGTQTAGGPIASASAQYVGSVACKSWVLRCFTWVGAKDRVCRQ